MRVGEPGKGRASLHTDARRRRAGQTLGGQCVAERISEAMAVHKHQSTMRRDAGPHGGSRQFSTPYRTVEPVGERVGGAAPDVELLQDSTVLPGFKLRTQLTALNLADLGLGDLRA